MRDLDTVLWLGAEAVARAFTRHPYLAIAVAVVLGGIMETPR